MGFSVSYNHPHIIIPFRSNSSCLYRTICLLLRPHQAPVAAKERMTSRTEYGQITAWAFFAKMLVCSMVDLQTRPWSIAYLAAIAGDPECEEAKPSPLIRFEIIRVAHRFEFCPPFWRGNLLFLHYAFASTFSCLLAAGFA